MMDARDLRTRVFPFFVLFLAIIPHALRAGSTAGNGPSMVGKTLLMQGGDGSWRPREFLVSAYNPPYAWRGPPYLDSVFTYYENANFDNLLWVRDEDALMEKVHQYGLKYFVDIKSLFPEVDPNGVDYLRGVKNPEEEDETYNVRPEDITEAMLQRVDRVVEKHRDDPDLMGYWICDEPFPAAYRNIARVLQRIRDKDPYHYSLVNIGDNEYTTDDNVEDFIHTTGTEVLCYDRYEFFNGYDLDDLYFQRLAMMRRHALQHHLPFYNTIQAVGTNGTSAAALDWRTPNEAEHRWLVYSSLAYGVHGIVWFHWDAEDWGVMQNPDRDLIYPSIQRVNAEIASLGPVMLHLTSTEVYHTDTNDYGTDGPDRIIREVSAGAALVVGSFKDEAGHEDYFMLMNKDYSNAVTATVSINCRLDTLDVFDVANGRWEDVPFENGTSGATFTVALRKGGGKLLRFGRKRIRRAPLLPRGVARPASVAR